MITDSLFYAVAAPAVLLLGVSKSRFGAGFGSLAVPLMAFAVTVPQAAAILMPVLLPLAPVGVWAGGRAHCAAYQPARVLPGALWRHVFNRLQAAVGRAALIFR